MIEPVFSSAVCLTRFATLSSSGVLRLNVNSTVREVQATNKHLKRNKMRLVRDDGGMQETVDRAR